MDADGAFAFHDSPTSADVQVNESHVLQLCTARSERFGCRVGRKLSGVTYTHHVYTTLERGKDESRHRWASVCSQIKRLPDRNWRVSLLFL